jgi:hypothetical protein
MKRAMLGLGIREPVNVRFWPKRTLTRAFQTLNLAIRQFSGL